MAMRFADVLGSSGSVIPKFRQQIAKGGPVTVTHPEIIRYFMTIPEAVQLSPQAGAIGERGQVLVLDMGDPVRIVDLAKTIIRMAGRPEQEIAIRITWLRPGEKRYEELIADSDQTLPTRMQWVSIAKLGELTDDSGLIRWGVGTLAHGDWSLDTVAEGLARRVEEDGHAAVNERPATSQEERQA